jgi:hypothetical protein
MVTVLLWSQTFEHMATTTLGGNAAQGLARSCSGAGVVGTIQPLGNGPEGNRLWVPQ